MAHQYSVAVNNARLDVIESTVGPSPTLELWSGTKPASCSAADADDGILLASGVLPADWMAAASNASKEKTGTWSLTGVAEDTATHFRLKKDGTCHMQGTVTELGGGGDIELDSINISVGKLVTVNSLIINSANT